jgi:hypothetical protein
MKISFSQVSLTLLILVGVIGCTPKTTAPTPISSIKPTEVGTDKPAETTDQTLVRSVMAVLITAKEKNYGKQYDVLLCTTCKSSLTRDEYIKIWTDELNGVTLQNVTLPDDNAITTSGTKAEVSPVYKESETKNFTPKNPLLKTLAFVKEEDGIWRLNISK